MAWNSLRSSVICASILSRQGIAITQLRTDPQHLAAYPLAEGARYVRLAPATLRSWVIGRNYPKGAGVARFAPLIRLPDARSTELSFANLVEAHVLRALRLDHAVSIKDVRAALKFAEKAFGINRLLLSPGLRTDAGNVFLEHYGELINLSKSGQLAMKKLLEAHLRRVEWGPTDVPSRLYPFVRADTFDASKPIVIDPLIAFGRPVILRRGVSTSAIAARIDAGETVDELADDYDLEPREIEEAVVYERAA
jgi:uncharacterized protein (DUF433 family)